MLLRILDDIGGRKERGRRAARDDRLDLACGQIEDAVAIGRAGRIGAGDNQCRAVRSDPFERNRRSTPGRRASGKNPDPTGPEVGRVGGKSIDPQTDRGCRLRQPTSGQERKDKEPLHIELAIGWL